MSAHGQPIEVFNRTTGSVEREAVLGERWLRWVYENPVGRCVLPVLARRALFSRFYGWRMDRPGSARLIGGFIEEFGLDVREFAEPPGACRTFNEFFARRLAPKARPIDPDPRAVVFPADGRHLGFSDLGAVERIYAKGQTLALDELLGDKALAARFARGSLVISRLCPTDYHRFHFPCEGRLLSTRPIAGSLYSVNPIAVRRSLRHLVGNKRVVSVLESPRCGTVVMVEIGATCVGTIVASVQPGAEVRTGDEKGFFRFGGSCVMTLFEPGRVEWAKDLREQTALGRELLARMGDTMGRSDRSR
jgi:phosphatidylserine decarboxylase